VYVVWSLQKGVYERVESCQSDLPVNCLIRNTAGDVSR
jgi:hypothetical protein